jgi:hypothetical protein
LLLPAVQKVREAAARMSCQNKLKQLGIALHGYHDANSKLPPGAQNAVCPGSIPNCTTGFFNGTSWIVFILPHIEQDNLFRLYNFDQAYNSANNAAVGMNVIPTLYCPSGPDARRYTDPNSFVVGNPSTHYYGVMGPAGLTNPTPNVVGGMTFNYVVGDPTANGSWSAHGMLSHYRDTTGSVSTRRIVKLTDVTDGLTNTLMVGEISVTLPGGQTNQYRTWIRGNSGGSGATKNIAYPINSTMYNGSNNFNNLSMGSNHSGGCNFALGDASVRFINQNIDMSIYMAAASIDQREVAPLN